MVAWIASHLNLNRNRNPDLNRRNGIKRDDVLLVANVSHEHRCHGHLLIEERLDALQLSSETLELLVAPARVDTD